jgi:hypothetical protein
MEEFIMKEKLKENFKIVIIMIALTILISIPYLNKESIFVHDISYHTNRIVELANELKNGNFPVLIHSNLLGGFGYANSIFYPELFLYIPAILVYCGVNFLISYKILTILSTFFTILFTYYSANIIFKKKNIAWTVTLLYSTAFYRLTDIYVRGAIGEVLAITFLPLILAGIYEILLGDNKKWWIICFGFFGLVNSHVLTFTMSVIFIILLCVININKIFKDKKRLINLVIAGVISILLICSFVLPYLEQASNDKFNVDEKIYDGAFLKSYSVSFKELINNKFSGGDYYKCIGTILLVLPFFIFKCKDKENETIFMKQIFSIGVILLIMTTQFPYRLNIIITLIFSFVGGYSVCNLINNKEEINYLLYIGIILFTLNLLSQVVVNGLNLTEEQILNFAPVGNAEYEPLGLILDDKDVHNINSEEKIDFERYGSKIEFYYEDTENEMIIHIPFTYYKGYKAYIEDTSGNKTELTVSEDENTKNVIISNNEIITGKITVEYKITFIQIISYIITTLTMICVISYIFYLHIKNNDFQAKI